MDFRELVLKIAYAIALLPGVIILIKRSRWPEIDYIKPLAILTTLAALYEIIVTGFFSQDTKIWFKVYTFLEFVCIWYFFMKLSGSKYKRAFIMFLCAFVVVSTGLQFYWIFGGSGDTDSVMTISETVLVFSASTLWLKKIFTDLSLTSLWESPAFYFITALIFYFSGTFFLFVMTDIIFTTQEMNKHWIINVVSSLLLNSFLTLGIWKGRQKSHQYSG